MEIFSKMSEGIGFKCDYECEVTNMRLVNVKDFTWRVLLSRSTNLGSLLLRLS